MRFKIGDPVKLTLPQFLYSGQASRPRIIGSTYIYGIIDVIDGDDILYVVNCLDGSNINIAAESDQIELISLQEYQVEAALCQIKS
jgi:hypothetical protein